MTDFVRGKGGVIGGEGCWQCSGRDPADIQRRSWTGELLGRQSPQDSVWRTLKVTSDSPVSSWALDKRGTALVNL